MMWYFDFKIALMVVLSSYQKSLKTGMAYTPSGVISKMILFYTKKLCLLIYHCFQLKKKELKAKEKLDNALLKKSSLNISLLPEHEDDIKLASLLHLQSSSSQLILLTIFKKLEYLVFMLISVRLFHYSLRVKAGIPKGEKQRSPRE